jgi:hypothetical protein
MRVVHLQPNIQHTWPQLSVCLSCVFSESPVAPSYAQLGPVITKEWERKSHSTKGGSVRNSVLFTQRSPSGQYGCRGFPFFVGCGPPGWSCKSQVVLSTLNILELASTVSRLFLDWCFLTPCLTPISKWLLWSGDVAQGVESLLCKCKALSSSPVPKKDYYIQASISITS